jgi:hypothetical protein
MYAVEGSQVVGVPDHLLHEFELSGRRGAGDVGWGGPQPLVELAHDLIQHDVALRLQPLSTDWLAWHSPHVGVAELVHEDSDVAPGELSNSLRDNLGPRLSVTPASSPTPKRRSKPLSGSSRAA